MDNIPIICVVCGNEFSEMEYPTHMQKAHPSGQAGSIAAQRNIPKQAPVDLPPGVSAADLPDPDFLATIAEMEKEAAKPQKPVLPQPTKSQGIVDNSPPRPVTEKKPIELKYKYEGDCPQCGNPVRTIMLEVNKRLFAVAYCLTHEEIKQIEVHYIYDMAYSPLTPVGEEKEKKAISTLGLPFQCNPCGKVFSTRKGLLLHQRRVNHE